MKFKKSLGQNFLIDKNVIKKIVKIGNLNSKSLVLEIGPGLGNLTDEILKYNPKKIWAIEKDDELYLKLLFLIPLVEILLLLKELPSTNLQRFDSLEIE